MLEADRPVPLVSFIIASYQSESRIFIALESLAMQAFRGFEVIIIAKNSTDDDLLQNCINKFQTHFDIDLFFSDTGIYESWNIGIALARGEWLSFLGDTDSFLSENSLDILGDSLKASKADYVSFKAITSEGLVGKPFAYNCLAFASRHIHCGSCYRASIFRLAKYDTTYHIAGDYELMLRFPRIKSEFVDREFIYMDTSGVSRSAIALCAKETRHALLTSKHIYRFFGIYPMMLIISTMSPYRLAKKTILGYWRRLKSLSRYILFCLVRS